MLMLYRLLFFFATRRRNFNTANHFRQMVFTILTNVNPVYLSHSQLEQFYELFVMQTCKSLQTELSGRLCSCHWHCHTDAADITCISLEGRQPVMVTLIVGMCMCFLTMLLYVTIKMYCNIFKWVYEQNKRK